MKRCFGGLQWLVLALSVSTIPLALQPQYKVYWVLAWVLAFVIWFGLAALRKDIKWRKQKDTPVAAVVVPVKPDYEKFNKWANDRIYSWAGDKPSLYAFGRNTSSEKKHNIFELFEDLLYPRVVSWEKAEEEGGSSKMHNYQIFIEWPNSNPVLLKWHCFEKEFDTAAVDMLLTKLEDPEHMRMGIIINNARKELGLEPDAQYFLIPEGTK